MRTFRSQRVQFALAAFAVAGVAAAALFTPVRAMVERTAPGRPVGHASAQPADLATIASAPGVISVKLVTDPQGPPPPAARFYGAVSGAASSGATVAALADDGATCGTAAVGSSSTYALDITSNATSCTAEGSSLRFTVGGKSATSTANAKIPPVSAAVHTDLSAR